MTSAPPPPPSSPSSPKASGSSPRTSYLPEPPRERRLSLRPEFRDGQVVPGEVQSATSRFLESLGGLLGHVGQVSRMTWGTLRAGVRRPFEWK